MTKRNSKGQFAKATPVEPKERPIEDWLSELPEPYRSQALEAPKEWPITHNTIATSLAYAILFGFMWEDTPQKGSYWEAVYRWAADPANNNLPAPWSPPAPKEEQGRHDALITEYHLSVSKVTNSVVEMNNKLDRIQRDMDLLKSGSSFMQEIDKVKGQPEEQGLEEGDYIETTPEIVLRLRELGLWRREEGSVYMQYFKGRIVSSTQDMLKWEVSIIKHRPDFLARAAVTARKLGLMPVEQTKEEPWEPKVGDHVRFKSEIGLTRQGHGILMEIHEEQGGRTAGVVSFNGYGSGTWWVDDLRPATPAEIERHQAELKAKEEEKKRKELVRGCRVGTPDGEGIYLGDDGKYEVVKHRVFLDKDGPGTWPSAYNLDQITPLP